LLPRGAKCTVIGSPLREAQITVRATEHFICVVIVLPVVFPEAHGADLVAAASTESFEAAAWAPQWKVTNMAHVV
jgi:hypothetical protein